MNIYLLRKYTTRINLFFGIAFLLCMSYSFVSYEQKKMKDPTLPLYAMFFRVNPQPSWNYASPFTK
jgi:hypothetical protein